MSAELLSSSAPCLPLHSLRSGNTGQWGDAMAGIQASANATREPK